MERRQSVGEVDPTGVASIECIDPPRHRAGQPHEAREPGSDLHRRHCNGHGWHRSPIRRPRGSVNDDRMTVTVAAVVVNWNSGELLDRCLRALAGQT